MMNQILRFLPSLFAAGLILGVGWFLARIVQRIVTNLLVAIRADRLSDRVGLAPVLGTQRLSGVLGLVVYILILIPVLTAALNALALEAITRPASNMLNMILEAIPAIFAAMLLVSLAYMVGRVVSGLIANLLSGVGSMPSWCDSGSPGSLLKQRGPHQPSSDTSFSWRSCCLPPSRHWGCLALRH